MCAESSRWAGSVARHAELAGRTTAASIERGRRFTAQELVPLAALQWALASGNWTAASEWEEQLVLSEDELARLVLERCFGDHPAALAPTEAETVREAQPQAHLSNDTV